MLLSPAQLLAIAIELLLMIVLPIVLLTLWCRRTQLPWTAPLIAAGCYLLNLVVNVPLTVLLYPSLQLPPVLLLALTALTYGVCEELARWLSFRLGSLRRHRDGECPSNRAAWRPAMRYLGRRRTDLHAEADDELRLPAKQQWSGRQLHRNHRGVRSRNWRNQRRRAFR